MRCFSTRRLSRRRAGLGDRAAAVEERGGDEARGRVVKLSEGLQHDMTVQANFESALRFLEMRYIRGRVDDCY